MYHAPHKSLVHIRHSFKSDNHLETGNNFFFYVTYYLTDGITLYQLNQYFG
jgi:hypothetical protein